jgi:hypothetical protein
LPRPYACDCHWHRATFCASVVEGEHSAAFSGRRLNGPINSSKSSGHGRSRVPRVLARPAGRPTPFPFASRRFPFEQVGSYRRAVDGDRDAHVPFSCRGLLLASCSSRPAMDDETPDTLSDDDDLARASLSYTYAEGYCDPFFLLPDFHLLCYMHIDQFHRFSLPKGTPN